MHFLGNALNYFAIIEHLPCYESYSYYQLNTSKMKRQVDLRELQSSKAINSFRYTPYWWRKMFVDSLAKTQIGLER